jgi:hypothetical protein
LLKRPLGSTGLHPLHQVAIEQPYGSLSTQQINFLNLRMQIRKARAYSVEKQFFTKILKNVIRQLFARECHQGVKLTVFYLPMVPIKQNMVAFNKVG